MKDLTVETLATALSGRSFEYHEQIDSTNNRALILLQDGLEAGSVVVADEQTRGRGRLGRQWHSPPNSALMFSYLVHPKSPPLAGEAGMAAALAVCEAAEAAGAVDVGIKWPNDVQIAGKKLSGILPESAWQGDTLIGVVLGIGINVRVDFSGTPLEGIAVSLESVVGQIDRTELLVRLLTRLDFWTGLLGQDALFDAWRGRLNMLGKVVRLQSSGADVHGIAESAARDGALMVRDSDGVLHRVIAGDIALGNLPNSEHP